MNKKINRINPITNLAVPIKTIEFKQLSQHEVVDPTLSVAQKQELTKTLSNADKIRLSLNSALKEIQNDNEDKGELLPIDDWSRLYDEYTEDEAIIMKQQEDKMIADARRQLESQRQAIFDKHGMEKQTYTSPPDDGNHVIVRDILVEDQDIQQSPLAVSDPKSRGTIEWNRSSLSRHHPRSTIKK